MSRAAKRRKRLGWTIAGALVVIVALNTFVVRQGRVRLRSMEPVLNEGDWVLFEKPGLKRAGARRFDIVVFKAPNDPDSIYIKRVIGLPGEIVEARQGALYVDGRAVQMPCGVDWGGVEFAPATVRAAHYFVVGDNPSESRDSRDWGGVPRDYILGRVLWRFWPPGAMKIYRRCDAAHEGAGNADKGI